MIVLHAGALEKRLFLWGETANGTGACPSRSPGRKRKAAEPKPLSFGAGVALLSSAVDEAGLALEITKKQTRKIAVWLPTKAGLPVPSGPLIGNPPRSRAKVKLRPWAVEALPLRTEEAVGFLCACSGKRTLASGVIVGPDAAFWAEVLRFAGSLVARQRYLPGLVEDHKAYMARWEAVLEGHDSGRPAALAKAMPPVARALSEKEAASAPEVPSVSVVESFIRETVDHLVRSAVSAEPLFAGRNTPLPAVRKSQLPAGRKTSRKKKAHSFDSVHDYWLFALRAPDGQMEGDEEQLARLAEQVREWRRPAAIAAGSPFRLCFRLEEPHGDGVGADGLTAFAGAREPSGGSAGHPDSAPGAAAQTHAAADAVGGRSYAAGDSGRSRPTAGSSDDPRRVADPTGRSRPVPDPVRRPDHAETWRVRYLLQATDDPSLLVPVADAWKARSRKAALLKRRGFSVREYLLSSLGQASGVCPHIEQGLRTAQPAGYDLDAEGAHEFLTEKAMALELAGFGVLLPAWWARRGTKFHLTARANVKSPKMQGGGRLSLDEVVKFEWEVSLGKEKVSLKELEALAKLKVPLVKVRGKWVQINAQEIQAALEFWKKKASGEATLREVVGMSLGARESVEGIAFEGVNATGWIGEMLSQLERPASLEGLDAPDEFVGALRPYQVRGYSWLAFLTQWGLGPCLADDMGLGKTIQTLALVQRDWEAGRRRPVLLVCPTSVVSNWQKEAARFTPELPVMVHHGIGRKKGEAFEEDAGRQAMVVSNYALLHRDIEHLRRVDWAGVVLDEAQNIKNPDTKQARSARSLKADYRLALTGTPVENNIGDLWSIMEFLNPGLLGTQTEFKKSFFVPIQAGRDPQAVERLKRITGPFILRRLKTDRSIIADLPEKMEMKTFCNLTKEQASLYAAVVKEVEEGLQSAEGIERKGLILAALSKLKQVCNHPAQFLGDNSGIPGRSGKLARLTEMLEEIIQVGDRVLIFSQFSEMGAILQRYLQETFGREALFLHGGVPKKRRDLMVERFQAEDGPPIFVVSVKAGGTGLNLARANHVFHFDRWWNPAVENQATDRAFRIGQTRNVQVRKFVCVGTVEEKIDEMIEQKREIADQVVGSGEGWLTRMTNSELKDVLRLQRRAVSG